MVMEILLYPSYDRKLFVVLRPGQYKDIQFPSNFVSQFLNFTRRHIFFVNCDRAVRTFPSYFLSFLQSPDNSDISAIAS